VILGLFVLPFDFLLCLYHLQDLTESELAEMPSYNLSKTVHNKWLQQFGHQGTNLSVATVNDFV
jgi:hypothetical protein